MRKTITAAILSAGLLLGGAGVAGAQTGSGTGDPEGYSGSAAGSAEILSNTEVQEALLRLILASGSAATGASSGSGTAE